jgi:hypothetical protein
LKGLFLDGDFEPPSRNLTASESLVVKEMQRLKEESILQIDFIQDIKSLNADALKIVFQNIQSFKKHKPDIVNDEFYKSSDILIFVEAGNVKDTEANFQDFFLLGSGINDRKCRGYLVFVKNHLRTKVKFLKDNQSRMNEKEVEIFMFEANNTLILGCYKAPNKSLSCIKSELLHLNYYDFLQKSYKQIIFVGDFNHDLNNPVDEITGNKFINEIKLNLSLKAITTDGDTQIDWCLAQDQTAINCGTYESYFSYHKALWIITENIDKSFYKSNRDSCYMSVDGLNNMYLKNSISNNNINSSFKSESNHKTELRAPLSETYWQN